MNKRALVVTLLLCFPAAVLSAAEDINVPIHIGRAAGGITVDGDLSDAGWQGVQKIETWYETNPGDNVEPKVKSVGYLAYDDHFLYAAFEFADPNPSQINAGFNDHDHISGNTDDYGGIILDTRNDHKTAVLLLTTARGVQYDALSDDSTGEDSSPDYFWDSAARITPTGWVLEMRVPFSSLRYDNPNPEQWGIMLYRNMPRDRRYQMFANKIPRGSNCFICTRNPLVGLQGLPSGGHMVAAPYVSTRQLGVTRDGLGSHIVMHPIGGDAGADVKWMPNADTAIDATVNPDFSQVESDVAVIETNERFAIFFPEKRPFFLEGVELLKTPIQAVYTRTITAPRWGLRSTGKEGSNAYTLLIAQDRGGGSVIIPSALGSGFADQDFSSLALLGRIRHDFSNRSFIAFLGSARESQGSAHNRVLGPDFEIHIGTHETITGQLLFSDTRTPDRLDLAGEWNGQKLRDHAAYMWWQHQTEKNDFYLEGKDYGDEFRADNGFVPQVGYRENYLEAGHTFRPTGFFNRVRTFGMAEYDSLQDGSMLYRLLSAGFGADGKHRSFTRLRYAYESVRNGDDVFLRHQLLYQINFAVNRLVPYIGVDGFVGQDVDFDNNRLGRGARVNFNGNIRPNPHLDLNLTSGLRWLNVPSGVRSDRLFTSQVERLRAQWTFNSRTFIRAIFQNTRTNRDQGLYTFDVPQHSGTFSSQFLAAYKLNWQTVMYVGYGDLREATSFQGDLEPSNRQFFAKVSYAFQR